MLHQDANVVGDPGLRYLSARGVALKCRAYESRRLASEEIEAFGQHDPEVPPLGISRFQQPSSVDDVGVRIPLATHEEGAGISNAHTMAARRESTPKHGSLALRDELTRTRRDQSDIPRKRLRQPGL